MAFCFLITEIGECEQDSNALRCLNPLRPRVYLTQGVQMSDDGSPRIPHDAVRGSIHLRQIGAWWHQATTVYYL